MTIKGANKQACAACKYQRRKCEKNCRLARYFPADQPQTFRNAHRLFGVSNIVRILNRVDDDKKDMAMSTIIYESNMRERYPVHGCWGLILKLQQQLQAATEEICYVNAQLAVYKDQCQYQTPDDTLPSSLAVNIDDAIYDQGNGNWMMPQGAGNGFLLDQIEAGDQVKPFIRNIVGHHHQQQQQQHQNPYYNGMLSNPLGINVRSQLTLLQGIPIQQEIESISIHDAHDISFDTPKAKEVCDESSMEAKGSSNSEILTKNKLKIDAASSNQFDLGKMTG